MNRRTSRFGVRLAGSATVSLLLALSAIGADHRDGPKITDINNAPFDVNDFYLFRSPANPSNTVFIFTFQPFPGIMSPETFDPRVRYEIKIDQDLNNRPEVTLVVVFTRTGESRQQETKLALLRPARPAGRLATGDINTNIPIEGGGMFRAGIHDDPFFFDMIGFNLLVDDGVGEFPRPVGAAQNFFGPNVNTLAIIIELPTERILKSPDRPIIRAWARTVKSDGTQIDRAALPLSNYFLIPPVPRNDTSRGDRRDAFNRGNPASDARRFRSDMLSVLTGFWKNAPNRAGAIADDLVLSDVLSFDISLTFDPEGFPNGRRLRDDVADYLLNVLSKGQITTDNVGDDNGDRITDGTIRPNGTTRPIAFPYIGPPNP
jgi:hypothetical protein